jgi:hypothetical protein
MSVSPAQLDKDFHLSQIKLLSDLHKRMEDAYNEDRGMRLTKEEVSLLWIGQFCEEITHENDIFHE